MDNSISGGKKGYVISHPQVLLAAAAPSNSRPPPDFVKDEATASSGFVASLQGCASAAVGPLEDGGAATVAVGSPTEALGTAVGSFPGHRFLSFLQGGSSLDGPGASAEDSTYQRQMKSNSAT